MRYVDEFRDAAAARRVAAAIRARVSRPWRLMEVCGGQTHAILRFGIDELLPDEVELLHGPGCPVCVTPLEVLDQAMRVAARPEVIFTSFGDMLRVPGSETDLLAVKARGGDVRVVYSPLDALRLAEEHPERQVVFFAVGFETTAPANAMVVHQARLRGLENFSVLVSQVLVPPAIEAILADGRARVQAFLAAGHVCTVVGYEEYLPLADRHRVPVVVTGFEPLDILQGVLMAVTQLEEGRAEVENQYRRAVRREGNAPARGLIERVFRVVDRSWRGIGVIPRSGLGLAEEYADLDAAARFGVADLTAAEPAECRAGEVLQGLLSPDACPAFGTHCHPDRPLGATMVSAEGACAAYYQYRRGRGAEG